MEKTMILTRYPVPEETLLEIRDAIARLGERHMGPFHYLDTQELDSGVTIDIWVGRAGREEIHLLEDPAMETAYLTICRASPDRASAMAAALGEYVEFESPETLRRDVLESRDTSPPWLRLGLGCGDHDEATAMVITAGLKDSSVAVRCNAARSAALARWHQLLPDLEEMLEQETDVSARQLVEYACRRCSRDHPGP